MEAMEEDKALVEGMTDKITLLAQAIKSGQVPQEDIPKLVEKYPELARLLKRHSLKGN